MTMKTSFDFFHTGLPGNPLRAGKGTADIAQYFGFAFEFVATNRLSFGEDELFVGEGKEILKRFKSALLPTLVSCLEQVVQQFFSIKYLRQSS